MTLTRDTSRATFSALHRLAAAFARWNRTRRGERLRARTRAALQREPDWLLEDIGVRRSGQPVAPRRRRGFW